MSLLAVLCWRYPEWLTTRELREVYDPEVLRIVLMLSMWSALGFAALTFVLSRKRYGALGFVFIEKLIPRYPDQAILRPQHSAGR